MTRWRAARQTALTVAFLVALAWAMERRPMATVAAISTVSIYRAYREPVDDNPAPH